MQRHVHSGCTVRLLLCLLPIAAVMCLADQWSSARADDPIFPGTAFEHLKLREHLDQTLWRDEVEAQRHEQPFVQLWDELRARSDRFAVLKEFRFQRLWYRKAAAPQEFDHNIRVFPLRGDAVALDQNAWRQWLDGLSAEGYSIVQTEWHHSAFTPSSETAAARSVVSFVIDVERESPPRRTSIRGNLNISWAAPASASATPVAETIEANDVTIWVRDAKPAFEEVLSTSTDAEHKRLMPLIVYDLDRDGLSEIVLGGLNRIYWNKGEGQFFGEPIAPGLNIFDCGVIADFTGDGLADFICVGADRHPSILEGKLNGRFHSPRRCAEIALEVPKSMTAGDVDGDGDLDLWIGQYKFPYVDGSMPTPFYDSNDGFPSYLLENDGTGSFKDDTEAARLVTKRHRRTYSSSLVDLDDDGDLDLLTVNDFAGIDVFQNDGRGRFTDVTNDWTDERHLFGMGHAFADFNLDAQLDVYVIGMSSTTARRLDRLQLGRDDHPDINQMRTRMGYGNRLLLRSSGAPLYQQAPFNDHVARTGWSWGSTALDFDNDGDRDIYVANGHNSGRSAQDYCTRYWCHDVYTGASDASAELRQLFSQTLSDLNSGEISWNGFEHNVMFMNLSGKDFVRVGFLMGVASEFDSRGVVSEDLDADGRQELLYVQSDTRGLRQAKYTLHVLRNQLETENNWIGVRLHESADGPSPIGAQVVVNSRSGKQIHRIVTGDSFSSQHSTTAHFGLGPEMAVDSIEVHWPDGTISRTSLPEAGRYHVVASRNAPAANFARENLVAWCIVPFDAKRRSPLERAEMLRRLGMTRLAYDWREEHVSSFEEEIRQCRQHGIEFFAFWNWHDQIGPLIEKYGIHPQIWVTNESPKAATHKARVAAAADRLLPLVEKTRDLGCKLGLYNHGGWGGEPENLVAVCEYLRKNQHAEHVGIVYNFHHGHDHVGRFADAFRRMQPYLLCVNLNGMADEPDWRDAESKILPIGTGRHEKAMIETIRQSGYTGPIGILDHRGDVDAERSLRENIVGLQAILADE